MDASKFSNFTIDYILGETTQAKTTADFPTATESHRGNFKTLNRLPSNGFNGQASAGAMMDFHVHCPGLYDTVSCYNMVHCCGPVAYYQTNLNVNCCCEQCFYATPDCNKEENPGFRTTQQRQRNRIRTVFTESQTKQLDQLFGITDYPSAEARAEVAKSTGLSEETVRVWFKNRRARRKRQKSTSIATGPCSS